MVIRASRLAIVISGCGSYSLYNKLFIEGCCVNVTTFFIAFVTNTLLIASASEPLLFQ